MRPIWEITSYPLLSPFTRTWFKKLWNLCLWIKRYFKRIPREASSPICAGAHSPPVTLRGSPCVAEQASIFQLKVLNASWGVWGGHWGALGSSQPTAGSRDQANDTPQTCDFHHPCRKSPPEHFGLNSFGFCRSAVELKSESPQPTHILTYSKTSKN